MKTPKTIILAVLFSASTALAAPIKKPTVVWTAVFSDATPISKTTSAAFCKAHTPTVMVTTIKQITSKRGVKALNGIWVKYLSYVTKVKDHLYFNIVNAKISGVDKTGASWSMPMKLYEQTLSPVGVTWTVWSTPKCKGTFLGTPTITTDKATIKTAN